MNSLWTYSDLFAALTIFAAAWLLVELLHCWSEGAE